MDRAIDQLIRGPLEPPAKRATGVVFAPAVALAALLGALLCSCAGRPPSPAQDRSSGASAADAKPVEVGAAGASSVESAAAGPLPVSPFHIVAKGSALELLPLGDHVFVSGTQSLAELRGKDLVQDAGLTAGVFLCGDASVELFGTWPAAAWMVAMTPPAEEQPPAFHVLRWTGDSWKKKKEVGSWTGLRITGWGKDAVLALQEKAASEPPEYYFTLLGGRRPGPLPKPSRFAATAVAECPTKLAQPRRLVAFASGEVMTAGGACSLEHGRPAVERWKAGSARGRVEWLPRPTTDPSDHFEVGEMVARAPDDVWIVLSGGRDSEAGAYLAHLQGRRWELVETPKLGHITSISATSAGAVWLTATGGSSGGAGSAGASKKKRGVWRRDPDGSFHHVPVPGQAGAVRRVWARAAQDVWVETEEGILRTIPADEVLEWMGPDCYTAVTGARKYTKAKPCYQAPFVHFPTAAGAQQHARVVAILAAVTAGQQFRVLTPERGEVRPQGNEVVFIETEEFEKRYFGAVVGEEETGEQLARLVGQQVPGTRPRLLCANPLPKEVIKP